MRRLLPTTFIAALLLTSLAAVAPPVLADEPGPSPAFSPMEDRPECNFTWLRADGVGVIGSTALYVHDNDLKIFIEAFPASGTDWDPRTVTECDIIIQEYHGHSTHYDPATVAMVQKNTGAIVVGNAQVRSDMLARGVPSSNIVELSPTLGGTASASDVAGCNITAIGMVHTMATSVQVDTYYVEMPSGIRWFHGTCASSSSYGPYIRNRALLDDLDMIALDFEHNFNTVWDEKSPNLLIETHTFSTAGEGYYWDRDPSTTGHTRLDHNDTYHYKTPLPPVAPILGQGSASPLDATEDDDITFRVMYSDANDDAPQWVRVVIRDAMGTSTQHDMTAVPSGSSWMDGRFMTFTTKLSPGDYTFRFEGRDDRYPAMGDIDWNADTIHVRPRNKVPELQSPDCTPRSGDTTTVFRFDVMYRDGDNQAPAVASLFVDGVEHAMESSAPGGPWNSWVTFHCETTLAAGENHRYYYLFSDGEDQVRLPLASESPNWFSGPVVELPNHPPALTSGVHSPQRGTRATEFTFSIMYSDSEGDRPSVTYVYIDGVPNVMMSDSDDFVSGVRFTYSTRLSLDDHSYYFQFSAGEHNVRLPETGNFPGPVVENLLPTAVISMPSDGQRFAPGASVAFRAEGSDDEDGDDLDLLWTSDIDGELGEGMVLDRPLSEGTHVITLTVDDGVGGIAQTTVTVLVRAYLPHVLVEGIEVADTSPVEADRLRVTVSLGNDGEAKATGVMVYLLVDGEEVASEPASIDIGETSTVSLTWVAVAGQHTLRAEAVNASSELVVHVAANTAPSAQPGLLNAQERYKVGEELYFMAHAADAEGDALGFHWEFGDGATSTKADPSHAYATEGTYTVKLTVTDTRGGTTVETIEVVIAKEKKQQDDSPGFGAVVAVSATALALAATAAMRRRR